MADTLQDVRDKIEWEGFDYALIRYSSWETVGDPRFQMLMKAYSKAHHDLEAYIFFNTKGE